MRAGGACDAAGCQLRAAAARVSAHVIPVKRDADERGGIQRGAVERGAVEHSAGERGAVERDAVERDGVAGRCPTSTQACLRAVGGRHRLMVGGWVAAI